MVVHVLSEGHPARHHDRPVASSDRIEAGARAAMGDDDVRRRELCSDVVPREHPQVDDPFHRGRREPALHSHFASHAASHKRRKCIEQSSERVVARPRQDEDAGKAW